MFSPIHESWRVILKAPLAARVEYPGHHRHSLFIIIFHLS